MVDSLKIGDLIDACERRIGELHRAIEFFEERLNAEGSSECGKAVVCEEKINAARIRVLIFQAVVNRMKYSSHESYLTDIRHRRPRSG